MKWINQEISALDDEALTKANTTLINMLQNYKDKLDSDTRERKINPTINPKFTEIHDAVKEEIKKRNLWQ